MKMILSLTVAAFMLYLGAAGLHTAAAGSNAGVPATFQNGRL